MTKLVEFFNTEDALVLKKRILGNNLQEIERKAHRLLIEADEPKHRYYSLELQSFSLNW